MDDSPSASPRTNWLERLTHFLLREPENRGELVDILHSAFERHLLDADALAMIEGALNVGDMQVRDVMVPRSQLSVIDIATPPEQFIPHAIETGHSRFPVIDGNKDNVLGILLAKDLLRYYVNRQSVELRDLLRPPVFTPETKRLNILLAEFRDTHNHLAIVVDEHGGVSGLVTLEDVIEQIVGDIADEHDKAEEHITPARNGLWRVKGTTEISDLNDILEIDLPCDEFRTVSGLITHELGHVPRRGEVVNIGRCHFRIIRADSRCVHAVTVRLQPTLIQTDLKH
ncbi:HlyC/CorC family transporter [Chitiniphilus eburneus]|uniref:Magnesium and cobalt efflux protein CorC n=1 Tax=Chitiniphilus eburneus TaxID=2571148 RepID=A0A4V5MQG6_9NEIS|nr:transporter associated domain-containing protein [Chitiniphilus eburneus]TJZ71718.1 CBS domain-containing protein [Chitiniphilus eburneus]